MDERELVDRCVTSLDVLQKLKQVEVVAKRAHDGDKAPNVLRVSPSCVVASTVGVRDEGGAVVHA